MRPSNAPPNSETWLRGSGLPSPGFYYLGFFLFLFLKVNLGNFGGFYGPINNFAKNPGFVHYCILYTLLSCIFDVRFRFYNMTYEAILPEIGTKTTQIK
jgi:hypothetical protein